MTAIRTVLEILKWLPAYDILRHACTTSHLWFKASNLDELWITLSTDSELSPLHLPSQPFKSAYAFHSIARHLPILRPGSLQFLDPTTHSIKPGISFQSDLKNVYSCAAVLLPGPRLLVCGGTAPLVLLVLSAGEMVGMMPMLVHRAFHSLAAYKHTVYAIGGTEDRSAEKLDIEPDGGLYERKWRQTTDSISEHSACQPCVHKHLIYLCGGNTDACETFDPATETYTLLPLVLPESLYGCVTFCSGSDLLAITPKYVTKWQPGKKARIRRNAEEDVSVWTSMKQVLVEGVCYSCENGRVRVFDVSVGVERTAEGGEKQKREACEAW